MTDGEYLTIDDPINFLKTPSSTRWTTPGLATADYLLFF
jgi:hypothetical protein